MLSVNRIAKASYHYIMLASAAVQMMLFNFWYKVGPCQCTPGGSRKMYPPGQQSIHIAFKALFIIIWH